MRIFAFITLCTSALLLSACDGSAQWAYDQALAFEKSRAGLENQQITTEDGIVWNVLVSEEHADKPTVLLIHGFGADSSNWVRFANELEGEFRIIAPDLPGHGDTTRTLELDYTLDAQASRLLALMDHFEVAQFHAAGNSMGGAITLTLASQAPERVLSMGLINAAGLTRHTPEFAAILAEGNGSNPLIPHTSEDFYTTMEWAMEDPPYLPDFFIDIMGEKKAKNAPISEKIFRDLSRDSKMRLEDSPVLASLNEPALVLWGAEDRLLGVDNVEVFLDQLPQARSVIFDGIGHVPMAEAPGKTADAFRTFWLETRP